MIKLLIVSALLSSPLYFYFGATLQQWGVTAGLLAVSLAIIGKIREVRQNRMLYDQKQPMDGWKTGRNLTNNQHNQQPQIMVIPGFDPRYSQMGGIQTSSTPPIVWHDLPLERYELL
jgi:hypothetical protein